MKILKRICLFLLLLCVFTLCTLAFIQLTDRVAEFEKTPSENTVYTGASQIVSSEELPTARKIVPNTDITPILQKPELPAGCEATAAAMLLKCYGYDADKCDVADAIAKSTAKQHKGRTYAAHPSDAYIGDPKTDGGFGVFSPAMSAAIQKIIDKSDGQMKAISLTGESQNKIEAIVNLGTPVLIWTTMGLLPVEYTIGWYVERNGVYTDEYFNWPGNEHCVLLYQIDGENASIYDPLKGKRKLNKEKFFTRYNEVGKYAVILENK